MLKNISLLLITILLISSCSSDSMDQNMSKEEVAYSAMLAIKNNDRKSLNSLIDKDILSNTPDSVINQMASASKIILDQYPFPSIESWKKLHLFCQLDSLKNTLSIGIPLSPKATESADYIFEIMFSKANKITAMKIVAIPSAEQLPSSEFPTKEEKFNFTFDSLISIRLYYLPKNTTNPEASKSIEFKTENLTSEHKIDFQSILSTLNNSEIIGVTITTDHLQPTHELQAISFSYKDGIYDDTKRQRTKNLFILCNYNSEKNIEIRIFNVINATYLYKLTNSDYGKLKPLIDSSFEKYLK